MKSFLFVAIALACGSPAFAQDLKVRVHTVAAANQDSPVRVLALVLWPEHPESNNPYIIGVVLKNLSTKAVVSVDFTGQAGAPRGCNTQPGHFAVGSGSTAEQEIVYIEPGTTTRHWTGVADPHWAVSTSLWLKSAFIQVQVGIDRVGFSDGTSWTRSDAKPLDPNPLEADRSECSEWRWPEELTARISHWKDSQTGRLQGIGSVLLHTPGRTSSGLPESANEETPSYFYDCTVELNADQAHCGQPSSQEGPKQTATQTGTSDSHRD